MSVVSELIVRISADTKQLETGLASASGAVDRVDDHFLKITDSTLSWQAALGVLAGATGIALAAKKIFDIGSAVEETASKFTTVFGPATASVQAFIDDFASMAGLTDQSAKAIISTTGSIVQGMGFGQKASADFAEQVVRLAGDFASFNNVPIEETSRAIQSALTGERESLKKLGVVILETDVQKRAFADTGKTVAASLTAQEKATATLALITERAGVAVGDLERTQDSSANTARRVTAEFLNFRDGLAVAVMPALNEFLKVIGDSTGSLAGFADMMQRQAPIIAGWAKFAIEAFKTVALSLAALARVTFNTGQIMGESLMFFAKVASGQFLDAIDIFKSSISNMGDMVDAVGDVVVSFDGMRVASGEAWSTVALSASTAAVATTTAGNQLAEAAEVTADRVNEAFKNIVDPKKLRSLDFAVTLDAEMLYAAVIAGGETASGTLGALAERTRTATAAATLMESGFSANVETARRLVEQNNLAIAAGQRLRAQQEILAVASGQTALPIRQVGDLTAVYASEIIALIPTVRELTVSVRDAAPSVSMLDKVLGGLGGAAASVGGFFGSMGQSVLGVIQKFTPMGLAVAVIGDLMKELEPALEAIAPIVSVLAKALAAGIMPILKLLFPVIKFVAVAFTVLLEIIYKVAQGWLFIIGHVVKTIGHLIDALPFVSGEGIIKAGQNLLDTSKEMGAAADSMSGVRDEIRALQWPDEAQEAANKQLKAAMDAAAEQWRLQGITNEVLHEIRDAIWDKDFSPVINVTTGGSGGLTQLAGSGTATLSSIDQGLGIMGQRRNVLLTGDNSI